MRHRFRLGLACVALLLTASAPPLEAQNPRRVAALAAMDSARAAAGRVAALAATADSLIARGRDWIAPPPGDVFVSLPGSQRLALASAAFTAARSVLATIAPEVARADSLTAAADRILNDDNAPAPTPPTTQRPVARITHRCTTRPNGNVRCVFDGRGSTGPNGIASYVWTTSTEPGPIAGDTAVIGFAPGSYVVTLEVTDSLGLSDFAFDSLALGGEPAPTPDPDPSPTPSPTPTPTPTPPPAAGVELPRSVPRFPASFATAPCTDTVATGGLQAALNAARGGDVLCLRPGSVHVGAFTLPARADAGVVVVTTAVDPVALAAPGERIRPSVAAGVLARLESPSTSSTVSTTNGARGWYLRLLEVTVDTSRTTGPSAIVALGLGTETTIAATPRVIGLDRVWVHSGPRVGVQRCVGLNADTVSVVDSWLDECHMKGFDAQAIIGWNARGPYLIENNELRGSGENVMFGGSDPRVAGSVPADITMRRNHVYTPVAWRGVWTKKNLLELKSSTRTLVEGNVFDGAWADAQTGTAWLFRSSNQGGGCRWCGTSDLTVRRNLIVNAAGPLVMAGPGTYPVDSAPRRVLIEQNYAETGQPTIGQDNRHVMILGNSRDLTLRRNTWLKLKPAEGSSYTLSDIGHVAATNFTLDRDATSCGKYGGMPAPQWSNASAVPGLSVPGLAHVGACKSATIPNTANFATIDAALAAGYGVARAVVDAAVAGVVVQP